MHYFIYAADGDKPEDGYPLYIALHGGGASQKNDAQWDAMKSYYLENLDVRSEEHTSELQSRE